ncbi:MAG: VWA domain-containing protein [Bacteroidetes bacterium]|nr:VWA domain-containing protein [Bacteroidota bacterium]
MIQKSKVKSQKLKVLFLFFIFHFSFFIFDSAWAQPAATKTRILFVFDDSFSMFGDWQSGKKIDVAKKLLGEFLDSLTQKSAPDVEIALRCYGHQSALWPGPRNCEDTRLEVPFGTIPTSAPKMKKVINALVPTGTTPIAYSLGKCAEDFPTAATGKSRNIIILITDGIEECNGDPCAVSLELQKKGIFLKPFVIGIGMDLAFADAFRCVGKYYDATTEVGFKNILNVVISQALNNTTAQVNLLDISGKPSETDVAMTFYDEFSGVIRYNFMHTMNVRGNPDTVYIDPIGTYKLVVHTIPEVEKNNVKLIAGKHNIIAVDAPQGYLYLKVTDTYKKPPCIVRKKGEMQTLNVQEFNAYEKYIVGKYDLEILTLPRIYLPNVDIGQNKTTTIEIAQAGNVIIYKPATGPGSIYLEDKSKLVWVYNLNNQLTQENLTLQPGNYRVIYRMQNATETIYTVEKKFRVESGGSVQVKIY